MKPVCPNHKSEHEKQKQHHVFVDVDRGIIACSFCEIEIGDVARGYSIFNLRKMFFAARQKIPPNKIFHLEAFNELRFPQNTISILLLFSYCFKFVKMSIIKFHQNSQNLAHHLDRKTQLVAKIASFKSPSRNKVKIRG